MVAKIPGSQQSYGRKVLATLENTVIIFLSRKKTFCLAMVVSVSFGTILFFGGGGGGWEQKDHYGIF